MGGTWIALGPPDKKVVWNNYCGTEHAQPSTEDNWELSKNKNQKIKSKDQPRRNKEREFLSILSLIRNTSTPLSHYKTKLPDHNCLTVWIEVTVGISAQGCLWQLQEATLKYPRN